MFYGGGSYEKWILPSIMNALKTFYYRSENKIQILNNGKGLFELIIESERKINIQNFKMELRERMPLTNWKNGI